MGREKRSNGARQERREGEWVRESKDRGKDLGRDEKMAAEKRG